MLAYDYPLMAMFWTMTIFFLWASWWFAAIWSFIDNFRRRDHSGWAKAGWALFILLIPLIGVFAYLIARPSAADSDVYVANEYATS
jgi:phospholipase D-like protein